MASFWVILGNNEIGHWPQDRPRNGPQNVDDLKIWVIVGGHSRSFLDHLDLFRGHKRSFMVILEYLGSFGSFRVISSNNGRGN